jgi:hypothetical protein
MSKKIEPIAVTNGQPEYAQATMTGPDGRTMTIVAGRPPEIAGEAEMEAGG